MVEEVTVFECPHCFHRYDYEDDVIECIKECCYQIGYPYDYAEKEYLCETCGKKYEHKNDAVSCEKKHKEKDDLYYNNFVMKEGYKKLEEASRIKSQKKLDFSKSQLL